MGKRRFKKIGSLFLRSWLKAFQHGQNAKNRAAIQAILDDPAKFEAFRTRLSDMLGAKGIDVDNLLKLLQGLTALMVELMPIILEIIKTF